MDCCGCLKCLLSWLSSVGAMIALYVLKDTQETNLYVVVNGSSKGSENSTASTVSPNEIVASGTPTSPLQPLCSNLDELQDVSIQNDIINCLPILDIPLPDADGNFKILNCCGITPSSFTLNLPLSGHLRTEGYL